MEEKLTETEEQVLASEFILGQGNTLARDQAKQKRLSHADLKVEHNYDKELSNRLNIKLNNSSEKVVKNESENVKIIAAAVPMLLGITASHAGEGLSESLLG